MITAPFRTITGVCNNLENPYWGATDTPLSREIIVGEYDVNDYVSSRNDNGYLGRVDNVMYGKKANLVVSMIQICTPYSREL